MSQEIVVPTLGESVTEATVAKWFKAVGDAVEADEPVCELETDKVTVEVNAPAAGTLEEITAEEGTDVEVGAVLGKIGEGTGAAKSKSKGNGKDEGAKAEKSEKPAPKKEEAQAKDKNKDKDTDTDTGKDKEEAKAAPAGGTSGEMVDITVPSLGESVTEATVAKWLKAEGDAVEEDEPVVELETEKATAEVNAPAAGALAEILVAEGEDVEVGTVLARIAKGAEDGKAAAKEKEEDKPARREEAEAASRPSGAKAEDAGALSPAVRKLVEEHDLDPSRIGGSGKDGRLTKGDVLDYLDKGAEEKEAEAPKAEAESGAPAAKAPAREEGEREERVPMTRLRRAIARRLKEAQNEAAMLTTFNEVDMTAVMELRARYKDAFEKRHGVKLGFMSFFAKAAIAALQDVPAVNAQIDGDDIVYKNHYDIGIAVGTENGLVVPVVRDADRKSFAEIEKEIGELGRKARDGKLSMDELTGGTFTLTNGGIYGSLNSTPILNPPQSGILGMHKIQERPMAEDGQVVVRPMMYLALSYDHRIVDGREAVTFLVRIKECVEDPERLLLDM